MPVWRLSLEFSQKDPKMVWRIHFALAAFYGAVVVGMSAAISHYFQEHLQPAQLSSLVSSTAILALHALLLLGLAAVGLWGKPLQVWQQRYLKGLMVLLQLGLWLFVYTVWAGLFELPLHIRSLAPLGGQTLLGCWLLLGAVPFIRK